MMQFPTFGFPLEGVFTPTDQSGAGLVFTTASGYYYKIGKMVYVAVVIIYPATANGANATVGGLPFTVDNNWSRQGLPNILVTSGLTPSIGIGVGTTNTFVIETVANSGTPILNSGLSGVQIQFSGWYKST